MRGFWGGGEVRGRMGFVWEGGSPSHERAAVGSVGGTCGSRVQRDRPTPTGDHPPFKTAVATTLNHPPTTNLLGHAPEQLPEECHVVCHVQRTVGTRGGVPGGGGGGGGDEAGEARWVGRGGGWWRGEGGAWRGSTLVLVAGMYEAAAARGMAWRGVPRLMGGPVSKTLITAQRSAVRSAVRQRVEAACTHA